MPLQLFILADVPVAIIVTVVALVVLTIITVVIGVVYYRRKSTPSKMVEIKLDDEVQCQQKVFIVTVLFDDRTRWHTTSRHATPCHTVPYCTIHIIACHTIAYVPCHILCHIMPYYSMPYHIPYHVIPYCDFVVLHSMLDIF